MIESESFGHTPQGRDVRRYTLTGPGGLKARILTLGGIISHLWTPGRDGDVADITLGFDTLEAYFNDPSYFGAIVGRTAGRTAGGRFEIDGQEYTFAINDEPNHLHGGEVGFTHRVWEDEAGEDQGEPTLRLTYLSPDGEEGYPGNLDVTVTYRLTAENGLRIDYHATTDAPTACNLTNHAYFNLAGESSGDVLEHELWIDADQFVPKDDDSTLLPERRDVEGTPDDFREPTRLADRIEALHLNHGEAYLLSRSGAGFREVAGARHAATGRQMRVWTDQPTMQFYTAAHLGKPGLSHLKNKSGESFPQYAGFCYECQAHADGVNQPQLGSIVLRPGETYRQQTEYRFETV